MDKLYRSRSLSVEDIRSVIFSPATSDETSCDMEPKQPENSQTSDRYTRSNSSTASYIVDYGPIRVRHRRTASQTLATGRRSKYEPVFGEDSIKREVRRAKNRLAARDLKKTRDQIESDLVKKLAELEQEKIYLEEQHKILEDRKAELNRAVYNAKQAPLIPLITDMNIPIFFEPQERNDLLIDISPLLQSITEQYYESDC